MKRSDYVSGKFEKPIVLCVVCGFVLAEEYSHISKEFRAYVEGFCEKYKLTDPTKDTCLQCKVDMTDAHDRKLKREALLRGE